MRKVLFITGIIGLLSVAWAASTNWTPTTASVKFKIKNAGVMVDGSFSGLRATVNFDPTDLGNSKIKASVAANTIETGIDLRNKHLRGKDYFNVEQYPRITLESVSFANGSSGNYTGTFKLTIKNVTKTVSIPFTFTESAGTGKFKGTLKLDRLDYKVGSSSWTLGDKVTVNIVLNAKKK